MEVIYYIMSFYYYNVLGEKSIAETSIFCETKVHEKFSIKS